MITHKHKGAHSELIASAWLIEQGYEVFRNVSQHGYIDIIAIKDGIVYKFDVKTAFKKDLNLSLKSYHIENGINFLFVYRDGTCLIKE